MRRGRKGGEARRPAAWGKRRALPAAPVVGKRRAAALCSVRDLGLGGSGSVGEGRDLGAYSFTVRDLYYRIGLVFGLSM